MIPMQPPGLVKMRLVHHQEHRTAHLGQPQARGERLGAVLEAGVHQQHERGACADARQEPVAQLEPALLRRPGSARTSAALGGIPPGSRQGEPG